MIEDHQTSIEVGASELSFTASGREYTFPRTPMSPAFLDWVVSGRRAMYDRLEGRDTASFFGEHLPVVVTYSSDEPFPFNTGNKGVGLMPVPGKVEAYCELYQEALDASEEDAWEASLPRRLAVVRRFLDSDDISRDGLVTLEIFEKKTFANLSELPLATLHFTGGAPRYRSFQVNTVVEILKPDHPEYRFAFLGRRLFEHDAFHITQTRFPFAYRFHPVEIRDKTPYARRTSD